MFSITGNILILVRFFLMDYNYILINYFRCKNCGIALQTIEKQISEANLYKQKQIDLQNNIESEVNLNCTTAKADK